MGRGRASLGVRSMKEADWASENGESSTRTIPARGNLLFDPDVNLGFEPPDCSATE